MVAAKLDPAPRAQVLLPEDQDRHQRTNRRNVHPVDLFQHGLVVHQADHEHHRHAADDPVNLFDMSARELGVKSGGIDLHYANSANEQHEAQQQPIKIAE